MPTPGRRTKPLPRNWPHLRAAILRRDGNRCTWVDHGQRCQAKATDVDHWVPASRGGSDHPDNLRALCREHHDRKTAAEANAANPLAKPRRRNAEAHPGLIG